MFNKKPHDPALEAEWEVWYRDTFDRETRPSVDVRGQGLVKGLTELWARHLFETVRPGGGTGFSRFHLRWQDSFAHVTGDSAGEIRLREWVFGDKTRSRKGYVREGDARLLAQIAAAHAHLILAGQSGEPIVSLAASVKDLRDFEARLSDLAEN